MRRIVFGVIAALVAWGCSGAALAQYPGRIAKTEKDMPVLRSIAVLEWTGEPGKPSASRLVPISVFDGDHLNDGTLYLDRPQPMALDRGVEYVLQQGGRPTGVYDVFGAGEANGVWQGFGAWKSLSTTAETKSKDAFNQSSLLRPKVDVPEDEDKPVLHRKHPKETDPGSRETSGSSAASASDSSGSNKAGGSTASSDPDRPTLHRKSVDDASSSDASSGGSSSGSHEEVDPDRPTLRRHTHSDDSNTAGVSTAPPDPGRPRLMHGKPADLEPAETAKLVGHPPSMQQAVAVSDANNHPVHPWSYSWADPADETKYKTAMEALARTALGLDQPPAAVKTAKATDAKSAKAANARTGKKRTSLLATPADERAPLAEEQFHVYELAYGASATMVLTAATPMPEPGQSSQAQQVGGEEPPKIVRRTANSDRYATKASQVKEDALAHDAGLSGKPAPQKFVTLIAQPDLYGGVLVLYKSVTDAAHLDVKPRMRLVDAVDATADNRAELLFELRGDGERQFALYRVLRGSAEQMFATIAMP